MTAVPKSQDPNSGDDDEDAMELGPIRDWLSYAGRAIRARPVVVLASFLFTTAAFGLLAWAMPDRYYVETKLLAPRPDLIAILANPGRALSAEPRATSRAVLEILRRDNLVAVIRETGLLQQWRQTRPFVLRLKDRILLGKSDFSDDELTDILVGTLESRLSAYTEQQDDGSGTLTAGLTWTDRDMAVRLLKAVMDGFREFRESTDMAIVGESIAILEDRLAGARRDLEQALSGARPAPPRVDRRAVKPLPPEPVSEQAIELARLRSAIATKRRALEELQSYRQRRITELQTQLSEQRAVYSETHPVVQNIKRTLEAVSAEPPEVGALRREIAEVEARFLARGGTTADLEGMAPPSTPSVASAVLPLLATPLEPGRDYERSRLTAAVARYYGISDRLEGARLERDAARASARYRFVVVRPPLLPRKPSNRGIKTAIRLAGAIAGLAAGGLAAVALEARRGRIVQRWQVERGLGLPVLAEIEKSATRRAGEGRA